MPLRVAPRTAAPNSEGSPTRTKASSVGAVRARPLPAVDGISIEPAIKITATARVKPIGEPNKVVAVEPNNSTSPHNNCSWSPLFSLGYSCV